VTREIAAHPHDARLYLRRGELHRFHGELRAALADYERAQSLDPTLAEADLGRGRALLEANRAHAARHSLTHFVHARPKDPDGHIELARCLVRLARPAEAAAEYSRAIAVAPRPTPDSYVERANALAAAGRREEAIRGLDDGLRRLGPVVSLQEVAIENEVARKNWDGALARVDSVAALSPRRESWLVRRAEILTAAGRPREARATYREALAAIGTLPPRLRETRAMRRLEAQVMRSLDTLGSDEKEKSDAKS